LRRAFTKAKATAQSLREEHLRECASFLEATQSMSEKAAAATIAARERSSQQFRHLRSIFHKGASYSLDRIAVPNSYAVLRQNEETPRIPLVVKEAIEEVLVPHTERRFRQHHETPLGAGERQIELGIDCTLNDARNLMDGTYNRELEQLTEEART
jgi:hypothetical protein